MKKHQKTFRLATGPLGEMRLCFDKCVWHRNRITSTMSRKQRKKESDIKSFFAFDDNAVERFAVILVIFDFRLMSLINVIACFIFVK